MDDTIGGSNHGRSLRPQLSTAVMLPGAQWRTMYSDELGRLKQPSHFANREPDRCSRETTKTDHQDAWRIGAGTIYCGLHGCAKSSATVWPGCGLFYTRRL